MHVRHCHTKHLRHILTTTSIKSSAQTLLQYTRLSETNILWQCEPSPPDIHNKLYSDIMWQLWHSNGKHLCDFCIYNALFIYPGLSNVLHILRTLLMIFTKYIDIHYDNNIKYTNKTCVYNQNLLLFVMYVCMCLNKLALSFVSNIDVPCKLYLLVFFCLVCFERSPRPPWAGADNPIVSSEFL